MERQRPVADRLAAMLQIVLSHSAAILTGTVAASGIIFAITSAEDTTPGSPAPGCVPAPTRNSPFASSLTLCGRNHADWRMRGSIENPQPKGERYRSRNVSGVKTSEADRCFSNPGISPLQHARHLLAVARLLARPVHRVGMAQMRHRRQRIERVPALGRHARIGHRRAMHVKAHVVGQRPRMKISRSSPS